MTPGLDLDVHRSPRPLAASFHDIAEPTAAADPGRRSFSGTRFQHNPRPELSVQLLRGLIADA